MFVCLLDLKEVDELASPPSRRRGCCPGLACELGSAHRTCNMSRIARPCILGWWDTGEGENTENSFLKYLTPHGVGIPEYLTSLPVDGSGYPRCTGESNILTSHNSFDSNVNMTLIYSLDHVYRLPLSLHIFNTQKNVGSALRT